MSRTLRTSVAIEVPGWVPGMPCSRVERMIVLQDHDAGDENDSFTLSVSGTKSYVLPAGDFTGQRLTIECANAASTSVATVASPLRWSGREWCVE